MLANRKPGRYKGRRQKPSGKVYAGPVSKHMPPSTVQVDDRPELRPKCKHCESQMSLRHNAKTGKPFYGCSQYPKCKYTKEV